MEKKMSSKHQARMDLLQELKDMAMKQMHEDSMGCEEPAGHMEKVMVAAKDKQGLEKGLDKAKEVLHGVPSGGESLDDEAHDAELDGMVEHDESPEALKAKIAELQAKLDAQKA